jgi:hypothetical protein
MEDTAKTVTTAKPKNGKRWEHKELEARIKVTCPPPAVPV